MIDKCEDCYKAILDHSVTVQVNSHKKILLTSRKSLCFVATKAVKILI